MKLDMKHGKASSGKILQTNTFGIGNISVILEILRSKLYSKPIKVICQEIASNARDAHREVGCENIPIEIKLPSRWDMTHRIRDFGPGISPERMLNVFIKYGESTKRENNVQNGGFGIGAKCPWSYSDMFTIVSITTEDGKNICRKYTAEVSSTHEGKLSLMSESVTDKPRGTEIIVSCKDGDINEFRRWTIEACQFWPVKPIITGVSDFEWPEHKKEFTGDNWFVMMSLFHNVYSKVQPYALIDGIPYALNFENMRLNELDTDVQAVLNKMFRHPIYLIFDVGEIPVAASREEIDYNDKSIKQIQNRLVQLANDIVEEISQNIASCPNLWEANIAWKQVDYKYRELVGKAIWNGYAVSGKLDMRNGGIRIFSYLRNGYQAKNSYRRSPAPPSDDPGAFRKCSCAGNFDIEKERLVFYSHENFLKAPNRRRLRTVFQENPDIGQIFVLASTYVDPDLADPVEVKKRAEIHNAGLKTIKEAIDLYAFDCLDNYDKAKIVRNKNGQRKKTVTKIWSFVGGNSSRVCWKDEDIEIDKGTGIYVILNRKCAYLPDKDTYKLDTYWLNQVIGLFDSGEVLYGISKRQQTNIGPGWITLATWMKNRIIKLYKSPDYVNAKKIANVKDNAASTIGNVWYSVQNDWSTNIRNQTGLFAQYIEYSQLIGTQHNVITKIEALLQLAKRICSDVPVAPNVSSSIDLKQLWKKVNDEYPLLRTLGYDTNVDDIYNYVNRVDDRMRMNGKYFE